MSNKVTPGSIHDSDTAHARLGPSSGDGWVNCALFPTMAEKYTDVPSFAAEDGTAGHKLVEMALLDNNHADAYRGQYLNKCDFQPDGFLVDQDMIDAVEKALVIIRSEHERMLADDPNTQFFSERRINPGAMFFRGDCWGTSDVTIVNSKEILSIDYKHGRGIFVPIEKKKQTILYLIGTLNALTTEHFFSIEKLTHAVIQPRFPDRNGNIYRSEKVEIKDIPGWVSMFAQRALATDADDPQPTPGEEQCQWCNGRGHCVAYANDAVNQMFPLESTDNHPFTEDITGDMLEGELVELSVTDENNLRADQVLAVLNAADYVTGFIKAVKKRAAAELMDGTADPSIVAAYKMIGTLGNRQWENADEAFMKKKLAGMGFKVDEYTRKQIKSAPQMLSAAKSLKFTKRKLEHLEGLITRKEGTPKLVPFNAAGKAVDNVDLRMFPEQPTKPNDTNEVSS